MITGLREKGDCYGILIVLIVLFKQNINMLRSINSI